jgi:hypothetical protein
MSITAGKKLFVFNSLIHTCVCVGLCVCMQIIIYVGFYIHECMGRMHGGGGGGGGRSRKVV